MSDLGDLIKSTAGAVREGKPEDALAASTPAHETTGDDETVAIAGEGVDTTSRSVDTGDPAERESASGEETPAASAKKDESKPGDKEVITVTDHKGKRQITVDFSDRDKTKKAFELAAGARKWQAERDAATKKAAELEKATIDYKRRFDLLEKVWSEEGEDGVIKLLSEGKRNIDVVYRERAEREARRLAADPAELVKMDAEEKIAAEQRERAKLQREFEALKSKVENDTKTAEQKNRESTVHPAFDKFRFDGKLGNEEQELMLDEMMWKRATAKFDEYEEQGVALTPQIVEREFKKMQVALSSMIKQKAEEKATQSLEKRKVAATENAQRKVASGFTRSKDEDEAHKALASGDMRGFFGNIGKYGKFFKN